MKEWVIKKELLPKRCEICHQTDYFNAENNYCFRCSSIVDKVGKKANSDKIKMVNLYISMASAIIGGVFISFILISFGNDYTPLSTVIFNILLIFCISLFFVYKRYLSINKTGICVYTLGSIFLVLCRLGLLEYLNYRLRTHTWTSSFLSWSSLLLYPEMFFFSKTVFAYQEISMAYPIQVLFLVIGSFLWSLPLLLIKANKKVL